MKYAKKFEMTFRKGFLFIFIKKIIMKQKRLAWCFEMYIDRLEQLVSFWEGRCNWQSV